MFEGKYVIAPSNKFIYALWGLWHNLKMLLLTPPFGGIRYFETIEDARTYLNKSRNK